MSAVDEIVYLLDDAFEGKGVEASNESQSLLANLATVPEELWRRLPPSGARSIESIALHVGSCKVMYDDHAFGEGKLRWDQPTPELQPWPETEAPMKETIAWIRGAHERFVSHVRALSDDDLATPRRANWGELKETRWLIAVIIEHDAYHAGEINHIRSLFAGEDRWRWQQNLGG
ncbi:MAG TPA: DinB family protein [Candidatus Limnocylindrales bacterium]|nr:DinB family protein [Candidatus Limnocylindrales bacterium]